MSRRRVAPPDWLNDMALEEWRRVLPLIGESLADEDTAVLASYCLCFARWRAAEQVIDQHGPEIVLRDDKGVVKSVIPSPQIGISIKYHDRMLRAASLLGITPVARGAQFVGKPKAAAGATKGGGRTGAPGNVVDVESLLDGVVQ